MEKNIKNDLIFFFIKIDMKNIKIIEGTYYYGKYLPPQLNTPSAIKKPIKIKVF
jgi:hypothetical protein